MIGVMASAGVRCQCLGRHWGWWKYARGDVLAVVAYCCLLLLSKAVVQPAHSYTKQVRVGGAQGCSSDCSGKMILDSVLVTKMRAAGPLQEHLHIAIGVGHEGTMQI